MFKKALQVATTFGVLLTGYAVYGHVFAFVARTVSQKGAGIPVLQPVSSKTYQKAMRLAIQQFGPNHWASAKDLQIRLYNADRGFWMYAQNYTRHPDGKHVDFFPFAIVWVANGGQSIKTATSDIARMELDQPFNLSPKPGQSSSLRVVHARLEGEVNLRDDKGTPNTADDLRIGPMTWIEYDETKGQINSESEVVIQDDVYRIAGTGMLIKLRPKDDGQPHPPGTPTGFDEAQTAYLFKNVDIVLSDVGSSGILPGTTQAAATVPGTKKGPTPLHLTCDGLMQVDFPRRPVPVEIGPPELKGPTIAHFARNVEVVRGKVGESPDQLTCDNLRLTLVPPDKNEKVAAGLPASDPPPLDLDLKLDETGPGAGTSTSNSASTASVAQDPTAPSPAAKGPMTDLTLHEAHATGHNVYLHSPAQGMKVRCNELIHRKEFASTLGQPAPKPDTTYFRGDRTTGITVEKVDLVSEGPTKGQVSTLTTIRALDAKIFDDHRGNDYAIIVAGGPGELETRPGPGLNGPVERTAHWNDQLTIQPLVPAAPASAKTKATVAASSSSPVHKKITLTGKSGFADLPKKVALDARNKASVIHVYLRPKPTQVAAKTGTGDAGPVTGSGAYEIEHLVATQDVLLVTPGKTLTARNELQAAFQPIDPMVTPASATTTTAKPPAAAGGASTSAPAPTVTTTPAKAAEPEPEKPPEPEAKAFADRVWARVLVRPATPGTETSNQPKAAGTSGLLGGGGGGTSEVDEVRLRGAVHIHQDPSPGKARGTEIVGEAVDLFTQGGKGHKFIAYNFDPNDPKVVAAKAKSQRDFVAAADALFLPLALVVSDEMVIRGHQIGLDQSTDQAWVQGNGSLTQMAARGFFSDKGLDSQKSGEAVASEKKKAKDKEKSKDKDQDKDKDKDKDKGKTPNSDQPATPAAARGPMTIVFAGLPNNGKGMRFYGRSTDLKGQTVAKAEFYRDVHAETEDSTLDCQDVLRTYFDKPIKLAQVKAAPVKSTTTDETTATPDSSAPEPEPKAELAMIEAHQNVVVVNTKRDLDRRNAVVQRQRIEGDILYYDKLTGKFRVPTEGVVYLYELEGQGSQVGPNANPNPKPGNRNGNGNGRNGVQVAPAGLRRARVIRTIDGPGEEIPLPVRRGGAIVGRNEIREPMAGDDRATIQPRVRALKPLPPLVLTQIHFTTEMHGRFGTGKETDKAEDRWADFFGDVEALRARVARADVSLDVEHLPDDAIVMTSQTMRVVSEPPSSSALDHDAEAPPRYLLRAWEDAYASSVDKTIQADIITYDSLSNLLFAYGEDGREIMIAQQDQVGQAAALAPGRTWQYNVKTGQSQLTDPRWITFFDRKTGFRPGNVKPPADQKPRFLNRKKFQNLRGSIERKGYSGGQ